MISSSRSTGLVLVALAACLVMALAAACGGSSGSSSTSESSAAATSPYAGTWNLDGAGMTLDQAYKGYSIGSPGAGGSVTVSADAAAVTMTGSNGVTWDMVGPKVDGEYLLFKAGTSDFADEWAIRLSDGKATLTKKGNMDTEWEDGYPLTKAQ